MMRVDVTKLLDDDTADILCGLVIQNGQVICAEGDARLASDLIEHYPVISEGRELTARESPREWFENLHTRSRGGYLSFTEPYEDDDDLYDEGGVFVGDADNPPLHKGR